MRMYPNKIEYGMEPIYVGRVSSSVNSDIYDCLAREIAVYLKNEYPHNDVDAHSVIDRRDGEKINGVMNYAHDIWLMVESNMPDKYEVYFQVRTLFEKILKS